MSALQRLCLPSREAATRAESAWGDHRNAQTTRIGWQFATGGAHQASLLLPDV